ncbi:MAG TPA: hypothetical protein VIJ68_04320 [Candidatus Saccharimonadales bacterium]
MSKRRGSRGPAPLQGRARPIGPVFALARYQGGLTEPPIDEKPIYEPAGGIDGGQKLINRYRQVKPEITLAAKLVSIGSCGINLAQINRGLSVTAAQRHIPHYSTDRRIRFDPLPVTDSEAWEGLLDDSADDLLITRGLLSRAAGAIGIAKFEFEPLEWGIAQPGMHQIAQIAAEGLVAPELTA